MPVLFAGVQGAGATHAAHDLVKDEEHAVAIADGADVLEVVGDRRNRAGGGAHDGLGDKGHDGVGSEFENPVLKRLRRSGGVGRVLLAGELVAVGVARIDVVRVDQERFELGAAPLVAAGGKGAEGVAMVALPARDDVAAGGLTFFHVVLAGHLERGFHRL